MRITLSASVLRKVRLVYQIREYSSIGYWNFDWQPGPYPKTEKERRAAARKYNLLPHEYEPYKEDELIVPGDYPKLPDMNVIDKDIYYPWDLPDERRNFGEPMHANALIYTEDKADPNYEKKEKFSTLRKFLALVIVTALIHSLSMANDFRFFPPVAARAMPKEGVSHFYYPK